MIRAAILAACALLLAGCGGGGGPSATGIVIDPQPAGGVWYAPGDPAPVSIFARRLYVIKARRWTDDARDLAPNRPALGSDRDNYLTLELANSPMSAFSGPLGLYDTRTTQLWGGIAYPVKPNGCTFVPCTWHRVYTDETATDWVLAPGGPENIANLPFVVFCHEVNESGARLTFGE